MPVVSVGDVLRKEIASGSAIGREAASYMDFGRLVPDRVAVAAVEAWLAAGRGIVRFRRVPAHGRARRRRWTRCWPGTMRPLTAALWLELDEASPSRTASAAG